MRQIVAVPEDSRALTAHVPANGIVIKQRTTTSSPLTRNLVVLLLIRCIALLGVLIATFWVHEIRDITLPLSRILPVLIGGALLTALSFARLLLDYPVTNPEFLAQVLLDVLALSLLLYVSGGYTNPIVSYYLVPIAVAATVMSRLAAWSITLLSITAYSLLMVHYEPLEILSPHMHMQHESIDLHLFGMWFTFVLSAILITHFVVRMANTVRESEQALVAHHEKEMRNEHLISLATLAAGTVHELATPLSSMKVILHDLREASPYDADLKLLNQQIAICQQTLRKLSKVASQSDRDIAEVLPVQAFLNAILERWKLLRPDTHVRIDWQEISPYEISAPASIAHSLMNLLNNAADASPEQIDVKLLITPDQIDIEIQDYGPGMDSAVADKLGRSVITTKDGGIGIGLLLTHASLGRYGGEVTIRNNKHGTITFINLPTQELRAS